MCVCIYVLRVLCTHLHCILQYMLLQVGQRIFVSSDVVHIRQTKHTFKTIVIVHTSEDIAMGASTQQGTLHHLHRCPSCCRLFRKRTIRGIELGFIVTAHRHDAALVTAKKPSHLRRGEGEWTFKIESNESLDRNVVKKKVHYLLFKCSQVKVKRIFKKKTNSSWVQM